MSARGHRNGRVGGSVRRLARGFVAVALLAGAVPLVGLLIAFPLWYVATNARGLYTLLLGLVIAGFVIRHVVEKAHSAE
ncbi:MAG: hypothetical protein ACOC6J_10710 [Spirochaetota bacterium]